MGMPLHSVARLRELEACAARGLAAGTLMQRAGAAAARRIVQRLGVSPRSVAVVCGGGNNGGDGYVCALELARRSHRVVCIALAEATTEDARAAAAAWRAAGGSVLAELPEQRFDAVVDGIFGIGLARPIAGRFLEAVEWINTQPGLIVALDVPTGLDADRGCWVGGVVGVFADLTVTFLGAKPGLFTAAGCDAAGEVLVENLGVEQSPSDTALSEPDDFGPVCGPRARDTHKGSFGSLGVLGGDAGMIGAPLLAGRAALRLGAGRVFVECIGSPGVLFDPLQPELMLRPLPSADRLDAMVVGCGLGAAASGRASLASALGAACPVVLDADALNLLAVDGALRERSAARMGATILTPHPLEAARLLDCPVQDVQLDRLGSARRLSRDLRAIVVLKGAGTIVAALDARAWINTTGTPALATPGSGDALGGMIGALLAQGFAPIEATLAGVWLHGKAADDFGDDVGLVAGEIAALAARRLAALRRTTSA